MFGTESFTAARWLLLVAATVFALISLALRAGSPRRSELMVDAAGLAILFIALQGVWLTLFLAVAFQPPPSSRSCRTSGA